MNVIGRGGRTVVPFYVKEVTGQLCVTGIRERESWVVSTGFVFLDSFRADV